MPHEATWHVFCSTSALRIRFQVGLLVVFDEGGVRLGISGEGGVGLVTSGVVKVFGGVGLGSSDVVKVFGRVGLEVWCGL